MSRRLISESRPGPEKRGVMALMIQAIKVAIYSLALLQLGVALGDASKYKEQKLCDNKHLKLREYSDLRRTKTDGCAPEVKLAFNEFKDSVSTEWHDVCTMVKATNLTRFFDTHLKNKETAPASEDKGAALPRKFVRYAIAYGMELGSICRQTLVNRFYKYTEGKLFRSDFEAVEEWIGDNGPIARILNPISKQAEFPLPSDFIDLVPEFEEGYKAVLKLADGDKYSRAEEVCKKRFRPLYEPIILPISHLARNGFTYNTPKLARDLRMSQNDRNRYARWSRIVFLCESLKVIQFVGESHQIDVSPGAKACQQTIAPKELTPIKPFVLRKRFAGPGTDLWTMFDFRLDTAVRNYKFSMTSADRFKRRLLKNKGKLLLAAFKSTETMASLVERAFEIVSRGRNGEEAEELESTKRNLLSLVDSDKKSKFVKVVTKLATGGGWVLRKFGNLLEVVLLLGMLALAVPVFFVTGITICAVGTAHGMYRGMKNRLAKLRHSCYC